MQTSTKSPSLLVDPHYFDLHQSQTAQTLSSQFSSSAVIIAPQLFHPRYSHFSHLFSWNCFPIHCHPVPYSFLNPLPFLLISPCNSHSSWASGFPSCSLFKPVQALLVLTTSCSLQITFNHHTSLIHECISLDV